MDKMATSNLYELPDTAPLKSHVADRIRNAILAGTFKPGDRLNETHIASQFKVSRIPVREALQQLQAQGLVMNYPRRGMFVITLSEEDVQRINSLRILLEAEAIKLCRANLTATQERRLTSIVEEMENTTLHSYFDASLLDLKFHRNIWACSGNPYLEKNLDSLWPLDHHRPLLELIRGTSSLSPETAMINHLRIRYTNPERFSSLALSPTIQSA
jgi:DNA-binding GntR family transcriptional regulator